MTVDFFRMPTTDKRLGRNVKHDERSIGYAFRSPHTIVQSVRWQPAARVFDQGSVGSCTGNAGLTAISCAPYASDIPGGPEKARLFVEADAVALYAEATRLDDYQGDYPPEDTGCDGLSIGKALTGRGWISGYQHVLSGVAGVALALQDGPAIAGINWYSTFYDPTPAGVVEIGRTASVVGGHEIALIGYDSENDLFEFRNSWGTEWGQKGNAFIAGSTLDRLLGESGDVTTFVKASEPAPEPIENLPLARLLGKLDPWFKRRIAALGANAARDEIRRYLRSIGAM